MAAGVSVNVWPLITVVIGVGAFPAAGMVTVWPARTVLLGVAAGVIVNVWPLITVVIGAGAPPGPAGPAVGAFPAAGMVTVWPARTVLLGVAAGVRVNVWPLITVVISTGAPPSPAVGAFPAAGIVIVWPARTVIMAVARVVSVNVWPLIMVMTGAETPPGPGDGAFPAAGMVTAWPARIVIIGVAPGVNVNVWPFTTFVIGAGAPFTGRAVGVLPGLSPAFGVFAGGGVVATAWLGEPAGGGLVSERIKLSTSDPIDAKVFPPTPTPSARSVIGTPPGRLKTGLGPANGLSTGALFLMLLLLFVAGFRVAVGGGVGLALCAGWFPAGTGGGFSLNGTAVGVSGPKRGAMLEPESTTGVLLRVSRTTLVTVDTAKTDDEPGFILDVAPGGEVGIESFEETAALELLAPAGNAGVCSDISRAG